MVANEQMEERYVDDYKMFKNCKLTMVANRRGVNVWWYIKYGSKLKSGKFMIMAYTRVDNGSK